MANRRMFSKTITNSSQFLMMPQSSQNLYFHLGMNADDDGFCEHFSIMRMTESKPDDLKILQAKGFVNVFDDRVLVILDWKENNYLRSDRYAPSKYLEIYKEEMALLSQNTANLKLGIPDGNQMATQDRLGKVRLGKDTNTENSTATAAQDNLNEILSLFETVNPTFERLFPNKSQRAALKRLIDKFGTEKIKTAIQLLPKTNKETYAPVITTPIQLEQKLPNLIAFFNKKKSQKGLVI